MAKKDQQSSWNSKRFKAPKKNIEKIMNKWQNKT